MKKDAISLQLENTDCFFTRLCFLFRIIRSTTLH